MIKELRAQLEKLEDKSSGCPEKSHLKLYSVNFLSELYLNAVGDF